ncbi:MAG TPA: VIT1/CCC1 transporter family protein [Burkholderiales bacterium]
MSRKQALSRYRSNLQTEIDSAALYRAMQVTEKNPQVADVYGRLAAVEEGHAEFWRKRVVAAGGAAAKTPGLRARALIWIARHFGPESVLPVVATLETMDRDVYDQQLESKGTAMPAEERSHARLLTELTGRRNIAWDGALFSRLEGRHGAGGGNALRAAILGANDGLVSNLSLVMGVAGAAFSEQTVLITGIAGLLAGSCSMAMGEWLSVQGARELYAKQIATEADELLEFPEEEKEELILIYRAKGMGPEEARAIAERVMGKKDAALDTLVREELGINPSDLGGSAWAAAISSFVVFMLGAIIPVVSFMFLKGNDAVLASAAASAVALFLFGAVTSLFTGRGAWFSGIRQLLIGAAAAAVTYGAGHLFGVAIAG